MTVNSLLSEKWVSEKSGLSFFSTFYDGGKQGLLRGREVIHLLQALVGKSVLSLRREKEADKAMSNHTGSIWGNVTDGANR